LQHGSTSPYLDLPSGQPQIAAFFRGFPIEIIAYVSHLTFLNPRCPVYNFTMSSANTAHQIAFVFL
jgi:hypothetical protein